MNAAILSVLTGSTDTDLLESHLGSGLPAADVESTPYLDGRTVHHGTLAGEIAEKTRIPYATDEGIHTEREEITTRVTTDFYVDLENGWAGVDASVGQPLLTDYLASEVGLIPEDAEIDLVSFAERLPDGVETNGIVYSQSIEDDHNRDAAGAHWHHDASPHKIPTEGVKCLSVRYTWDGRLVGAMLAASCYVAVYKEGWPSECFARWVADEVEPKLDYAVDDQQTLGGE